MSSRLFLNASALSKMFHFWPKNYELRLSLPIFRILLNFTFTNLLAMFQSMRDYWTFSKIGFNNICFLLLFFVISAVCGCNSDKKTNQFVIGFSQCVESDNWRKTMLEGMKRE